MGRPYVAAALPEHAADLAPRLREADRREVAAFSGADAGEALMRGVRESSLAWTIIRDGRPLACFGVAPMSLLGATGVPWLLGSDDVRGISLAFLRGGRMFVESMLARFRRLENYVDARNTVSVNWLRWLGFTVHPAQRAGVELLPFHRFEMERAGYVWK